MRQRNAHNTEPAKATRSRLMEFLLPAVLVFLVVAPWLLPGYLFGTDWTGSRRYAFPASLSSLTPVLFLLAATGKLISAEIAAKVFLFGVLFLAAWLAYRAVPVGNVGPRVAAAVVYTFNPFVYGRLHYGQFFVLAAYAVLPWILIRTRLLLATPSVRSAFLLAAGLAVVGALDLHLFLVAAVLVVLLSVSWLGLHPAGRLRTGAHALLSAAITLALCSYWLVPFLLGSSSEAKAVASIGSTDLNAYQAVADPQLGLLPNLLGLYGFWAEAVFRFPSFKLFAPYWQLVLALLLVLAIIGAVSAIRPRPPDRLGGLRWWVIGLVLTGAIGLVLELGVADPHVAPLVRWLDAVFPPYRGMRDSSKWGALLALVYAQLIPLGAVAVTGWLRQLPARGRDLATAVVTGLVVALPLYYGNGLLYGIHLEVLPSQYPAGWYAVDRVLLADPAHARALFLPWHEYLRYSFVKNVNSVVASPAPEFFSIPVVTSQDPEIPGVAPPATMDQLAVSHLVQGSAANDWAPILKQRQIKYVLLAKELDWHRWRFLDQQPDLVIVGDYGSIVLYRNALMP